MFLSVYPKSVVRACLDFVFRRMDFVWLLIPNRSLGLAWILFFRRMDFVWLLMSNSGLLRIKNRRKTPYKNQKTASGIKIIH